MEKPFFITGNDVRAEINTVSTFIKVLNNDLAVDRGNVPQRFKDEFIVFVKEWTSYLTGLRGLYVGKKTFWDWIMYPFSDLGESIAPNMTLVIDANWDKIQEFKQRAEDYRLAAIRNGLNTDQAKLPDMSEKDKNGGKKVGGLFNIGIPWWLFAGGGIYLLYKLHPLRTAHSIRSLMPSKRTRYVVNR